MSDVRFRLVLNSYPAEDLIPRVCKLLYSSTDKNLLASLSNLPYIVGRSFTHKETLALTEVLKDLRIGFTFKSQTDGIEDISFDPQNPSHLDPQSEDEPLRSLGPVPKNIIFVSVLVGLLGAAAVILLRDDLVAPSVEVSDTAYFAKIAETQNQVESKPNNSFAWTRAQANQILNASDSLRTYENSRARIRYFNGSSISVAPNTLIVIGESETNGDGRIDLEDGSLQAKLQASSKPFTLSIRTQFGTLKMKAPTEAGKEGQIQTEIKNGQLKVSVSQGSAQLEPVDDKKKPVTIQAQQQIVASPSGVSPIMSIQPSLALVYPELDSRIVINPHETAPINFECEDLGENTRYHWELASDEKMQNVLLRQMTEQPQLKVNYLDLGTVYWRVTAERSENRFTSPARRLYVEKLHD